MDVSVILCTWNNCRRLTITLGALRRCIIPANLNWELVLVNNSCTDETPSVAREFARHLPLLYVEEPRQGLSRARNTGTAAASGRLIVFTDDDVRPCPEWLVTYWDAYQERPVGFYFGGPITCEYETRPEDEVLRVAARSVTGVDWGSEAKVLPRTEPFLGANWACPADALRSAGGFDDRLGLDGSLGRRRVGEEFDLLDRLRGLGMAAWYLPRARVVHFVPKEKCGIEHVGAGAEAHGRYSLHASAALPFQDRLNLRPRPDGRDRMLAGVPWRVYLHLVALGFRWCLARVGGRKAYEEYALIRFCIGAMREYRHLDRCGTPRGDQ
jgi:glucosyl-dolichyl phosphate glucuronosyltransferase